MNREEKRPNTTPKPKPKYDFGDFDEDDPLAGLSLDEESVSEAGKKSAAKKAGVTKQKSAEEEPKTTPQPAAQPCEDQFCQAEEELVLTLNTFEFNGEIFSQISGVAMGTKMGPSYACLFMGYLEYRMQSLYTGPVPELYKRYIDDGRDMESHIIQRLGSQAPGEAAGKRKDDLIFSDDDNFLDDSLLGRGEKSAASHLEVKEKPRQFVLDKKYTQPKEDFKMMTTFLESPQNLIGHSQASSVTSDGGQKKDDDDDEEEDSFIVRARLRRQQAMANQTKVKVADPEPSVADAHPIITPKFETGIKGSQSSGFVATPEDAVESGQTRAPVATLGQRQGAVLTGGTEQPPRVFQSSHFPSSAMIRKLEIEKQYAESLLETTRKRYEEEVTAVEKSYKLRGEMEQLMEQHLARVKRMEQEKADLAAENYRRLEDQERTFAQETEKLKEKHRSLSAAVDQIQSNARDLGQLQIKMDEWNRSGLDEREIVLRSKDEQLNMLQARLKKQEEDNEKERYRLEDLIARMESQNRDQLRQLEEERWKLKQEQSRLEAQQTALETERRTWTEQQARERQSMDRARDMFLEEQQSGLSHLTDERRALAEERSKLNMEQKLHRERVQQEAVRSAQAQAEYDVLTKTISEEKTRAAERMRELQREEERINRERDSFHQRSAALEQEKERLEKLALNLKQRSAELDAVSEEANRARAEGDQAFTEAQLLQSQQSQRMAEIEAQVASIKIMEDHIAQN
nr:hypothetical protein BaRGS_000232 [Batillaria attramentaria]